MEVGRLQGLGVLLSGSDDVPRAVCPNAACVRVRVCLALYVFRL